MLRRMRPLIGRLHRNYLHCQYRAGRDARDLRGAIEREQAPMRTDAASTGFYESHWSKHPRLQVLTISELLAGKQVDMPPIRQVNRTFKQAPKARPAAEARQLWDDVEQR